MARARKTKSSSVKVNFKGVESRQTPPEGDYKLEVLEANSDKGPSGDMITFVLEIADGKYKGVKLWFYCPLQENSLWKLHAFLTALGEEVPEDEMDIDLSDLVGKEIIGVLTHETYQGKKRAKMTDFCSVEDYEGDLASEDDDDDKPAKGKKGAKGKASKDEAPDYEDLDEDELIDLYVERDLGTKKEAKKLDEDELREALVEADAEAAKASKKGSSKKSSKKDDDDEDDDKPAKGKKGKAAPAKKSKKKTYTTEEVEDMDEEELQELIDEHDLDVDLEDKKLKKLDKKVAAVVEALEEEDLIDDD